MRRTFWLSLILIFSLASSAWASDAPIHYHSIGEALWFFGVQVAAFALLVWFMKKFAWPSLARGLDAHRERYASAYREIIRTQVELKSSRTALEARIGGIEQATQDRIDRAVREAQAAAAEIRAEAAAAADRILDRAKGEIEIERDKAILDLRLQVADMAISSARNRLQTSMTPDRNDRLFDAFVRDLDSVPMCGGPPR